MWTTRAAIRPVPPHAVVPAHAVEAVETEFSGADDLEARVDRAFTQLEAQQPALARYLAAELDGVQDDTALALGHFLGVAVYEAFVAAFRARVARVDESALELARASLECDEELRRDSPGEALESDDVVALSQPHVVGFVREQLEAALEADEDGEASEVDLEAVNRVYRAVLVEVMALSHAVNPPTGGVSRTVMLA